MKLAKYHAVGHASSVSDPSIVTLKKQVWENLQ